MEFIGFPRNRLKYVVQDDPSKILTGLAIISPCQFFSIFAIFFQKKKVESMTKPLLMSISNYELDVFNPLIGWRLTNSIKS